MEAVLPGFPCACLVRIGNLLIPFSRGRCKYRTRLCQRWNTYKIASPRRGVLVTLYLKSWVDPAVTMPRRNPRQKKQGGSYAPAALAACIEQLESRLLLS